MPKQDHSATATWDTAAELSHVTKVFMQRQEGQGGFRRMLKPEFKRVTALDDVTLRFHKGEFVAYAGPNGAGKSTTFKLLCGLLAPSDGSVRTLELDPMRSRLLLMRRVGVLFGNRTELWWDHPVISSFRWKKAVWEIPDALYEKQLGFVTEMLDLAPLMNTFVRELSLGQRMRADLGLMLLNDPSFILLDEPTLGLDVLAKRRMIDALKTLNADRGVTILVTSHDLDDLTEMARRIVMIAGGKLVFDGTLASLRQITGETRTVTLVTDASCPELRGAQLTSSEENRCTYTFEPEKTSVGEILAQVSALPHVLDVELGRAPIEQAIADLYKRWKP